MAPSIPLHFPHQETQRSTGYINKIMLLSNSLFQDLRYLCEIHFNLHWAWTFPPLPSPKNVSVSTMGQRLSLNMCWSPSSAQILRKKRGFSQSTAKENLRFSHVRIPLQLHLCSSSPKAPCQLEFFPSFLLHLTINKYYPRLISAISWLMVE